MLIALQGVVEFWQSRKVQMILRDAYQSSIAEDEAAEAMVRAAMKLRIAVADPAGEGAQKTEIDRLWKSLREGLTKAVSATSASIGASERLRLDARVSDEQKELSDLNELDLKLRKFESEWKSRPSFASSVPQLRELLDLAILPALSAYNEQSNLDLAAEAEHAAKLVASSRNILALTIAVVILAAIGASLILARSIVGPVEAVTVAAKAISEGNLERRVPLAGRDEFGTLAIAINEMLDSLRAATVTREQLEDIVKDRTRELDQFFSLSIDLLGIADFSGKFLRVNRAFEETLGYTNGEIQARPFLDFVHPEDQAATAAEMEKYRATGGSSVHFENRYRHKNGTWRHLSWNAIPLREAGVIYAAARDVTDLKAAERAVRESEENLSITLQSIGDGVLVTDGNGRITRMNPVAEQLTGWTLEEARGRTIAEVFHIVNELTREPAVIPVDTVLETGRIVELANHTALLARDGSERSIADSAAPIRDAGGTIVGVVLVFRDVTHERTARQQEIRRTERVLRYQRTLLQLRDAEGRNFTEYLELAAKECARCIAASRVSIWRFDQGGGDLVRLAAWVDGLGLQSGAARLSPADYPAYFSAVSQLDPLVAEDALSHPDTACLGPAYLVPIGIVSMLDVPIRSAGRLAGVICCEQTGERRQWTPEEIKFVGNVASSIMLAIEHGEREAVEKKLRESEEYNRRIVQSSEDCLKILSLDGRILEMAEQGRKLMEISDFEKIRNSDWLSSWNKSARDAARQALEDARAGKTGRFQGYCPTFAGTPKWWDVIVSPIDDAQGNPVQLLAVSRDITRQRGIEEELRVLNATLEERISARTAELVANERRFRLMIEQVEGYAIFMLDPDGVVATWNAGAQRAKGYTAEEIIGRHYSCFYLPKDVEEKLPQRILASAKRDGHSRYEGWRTRKDGSCFWAEVSLTAIRDADGHLQGFAKVTRDLTERRKAENALREALETQRELTRKAQAGETAKSEFLAIMSHEVRTPMNGIIGYADLLAKSSRLSSEDHEFAQTLHESGQALLRILDDILDFSSVENGSLSVEKRPFSPRKVLQQVETLFREAAKQKGIAFHMEIDPKLPSMLVGDEGRLRQILLNLAGNAVKFTEEGGVTVIASAPRDGGSRWAVAVRDTGPGVPEDRREAVFSPFTQADSGSSRRHGGTGLGLAISKRLTELLGGTLTLQCHAMTGSEFLLLLPFEVCAEELSELVPAAEDRLFDGDFASRHPLDILVAEDDRVNLKLTLSVLRKLGYDPRWASNGREAVESFLAHRPNCILMDLQMPEMDGIEATQKIRASEARSGFPPAFISALTANTVEKDLVRCFQAGMTAYLNKPIRRERLCEILVRASRGGPDDGLAGGRVCMA